ncbi:phosphotransferase [Sulfitobacter sp. S0837]|uniref:aminoglycoside phosphotransferase family protein n=1 Tax=Sulfitobacter maritimus TaxID=2741719 RepID=UPI0015818223|nr:phosphotransferase [Sulfitobacter maritimus]NUH66958.1 phosphotransferase [Sulfitobacter maritimus]
MTQRSHLIQSFLQDAGWADASRKVLAGDASNRRYDRLHRADGQSAILMDAPPERGEDVRPFLAVAAHLTSIGLSAPAIYHADPEQGLLLLEDLGDDLFARLMADDPTREAPLYRAAVDVLVHLHRASAPDLPRCDAQWLTDMAVPAFEFYAPDGKQQYAAFAAAFHPLAQVLDPVSNVVILRDYHAENLLWLPDRQGVARVGLLDFQDALVGHPAYDLVSILQDARRDVSPAIEAHMVDYYLMQTGQDAENFRSAYALLGAQRNLRILGIFARLCLRDGKAHYVDLIPRVWNYLQHNLRHPALAPVARSIDGVLPCPTPEFLEHLKSQCATNPTP